jgi:hypothetical protein
LERPLYSPPLKSRIAELAVEAGAVEVDTTELFSQVVVNKAALSGHILRTLQGTTQVTLGELFRRWPLQHGLAELLAYLELAGEAFASTIDEETDEIIVWSSGARDGGLQQKQARLPRRMKSASFGWSSCGRKRWANTI